MPAPVAASPAAELAGQEVRRATRRAIAARAGTTLRARLADAWGHLVTVAVGIAVAAGGLTSTRERIAAASGGPGLVPVLPAPLTAATLAVMALAGLVVVLDRLGPVSATPAAAAWWLPLPADRRGLLAGELRRLAVAAGGAAALFVLPPALTSAAGPTTGSVLAAAGGAAAVAAGTVGATALVQTAGSGGRLAPAAGAVLVLAGAVAAGAATVAGAAGLAVPSPVAVPAPSWVAAAAAAVLAAVLLRAAAARLDRLGAARLRALGATAQFAAASVLSLDTRDLGRALAARSLRPPRSSRRFAAVTRPWQAVVAGDLATLARGRWQAGQLVVAGAVPVLVARTEGLGALPPAVWAGCLAGWALAAVAAGHPARQAEIAPALDRLLPLSTAGVVTARTVVPLAATTAVCALSGALLGAGSGETAAWAAMCAATAPAWAAAAVRGAYRPDLDWSAPVVSTPMGALPTGVGATLVQGVDVGVVGSLPLGAALLLGDPSPVLIGVQLVWSAGLATGALALVARRGRTP